MGDSSYSLSASNQLPTTWHGAKTLLAICITPIKIHLLNMSGMCKYICVNLLVQVLKFVLRLASHLFSLVPCLRAGLHLN